MLCNRFTIRLAICQANGLGRYKYVGLSPHIQSKPETWLLSDIYQLVYIIIRIILINILITICLLMTEKLPNISLDNLSNILLYNTLNNMSIDILCYNVLRGLTTCFAICLANCLTNRKTSVLQIARQ